MVQSDKRTARSANLTAASTGVSGVVHRALPGAERPTHVVTRAVGEVPLDGAWDSCPWVQSPPLLIDHFHKCSSDHRPRTAVRLLYNNQGLFVSFCVDDAFVRSVHSEFQARVSSDSCVEAFLQPTQRGGYFNFELNCSGTMLLYYIEDARRIAPALFAKYTVVPRERTAGICVYHSIPDLVPQEIVGPVSWRLAFFVPFAFFESFVGPLGPPEGQEWRANFFKCGDGTSHPHWASWSSVGPVLSFHQPHRFGRLRFEM